MTTDLERDAWHEREDEWRAALIRSGEIISTNGTRWSLRRIFNTANSHGWEVEDWSGLSGPIEGDMEPSGMCVFGRDDEDDPDLYHGLYAIYSSGRIVRSARFTLGSSSHYERLDGSERYPVPLQWVLTRLDGPEAPCPVCASHPDWSGVANCR
ncbi:hypothetical protein [Mycobacterium phage WXIN]|nr:hypothetical protein [Mycobacterium phage WXIN]